MDFLAIALIPVVYFFVVRPIVYLLFRLIPDGRLKVFLFRERLERRHSPE